MKIAVLSDKEGNALSFYDAGAVRVFSNEEGRWNCIREFPFELDENNGLAEIQRCIQSMIFLMDECRILMVKFIRGVPLSILKETGVSVWKVDGQPSAFFEYVREEEEKIMAEHQKGIQPRLPEPLPVGDKQHGIYSIDLVKVQEKGVEFNSKEVLLPFLQKQVFRKLEVTCEHVPKWFAKEFGSLKLQFRIEESNDDLCHAIVSPIE
ncbi:MAG: Fe-only nitrogenase accessory protein AnfO [Chlorobiaceae bacterium]|nr:Fe-only nitrogenase accessory protein AnfO [Chlorobiaceae bacterium]NTW62669.1 Fe-only nitrogenase accessory protein AnfO [Chlorobiaceae bacterium]